MQPYVWVSKTPLFALHLTGGVQVPHGQPRGWVILVDRREEGTDCLYLLLDLDGGRREFHAPWPPQELQEHFIPLSGPEPK